MKNVKPLALLPKHPLGIVAISLLIVLISVVVWYRSNSNYAKLEGERFEDHVNISELALINRMQEYQEILRAGAGLLAVSPHTDRRQWRDFITALAVNAHLPGIQGVGFAVVLAPSERSTHEASIRREGFPGYSIRPAGDREQLSAIVYLEPFDWRNRRAFGYDMYSEPVRHAAMQRAGYSGEQALSGKVTLVQETEMDVQPGFLIYQPIYRPASTLDSPMARRAALRGFVFAPFRARDLVLGVFNGPHQMTELELFDAQEKPENLLFSSRDLTHRPSHMVVREIEIAGHRWIARFYSNRDFERQADGNEQLIILITGLGFGLFVFVTLLMNLRYQQQLLASASALSSSNRQLEVLATRDALTGLSNRRHFDRKLQEIFLAAQRRHRFFSILLLDIDHFKGVNDGFGHQTGDTVLKQFAQILAEQTRKTDFVARYGGEEFVILIEDESKEASGLVVAEKIRKAISATTFAKAGTITTSIGVSCSRADDAAATEVLERADQALYQAKVGGRNCTIGI